MIAGLRLLPWVHRKRDELKDAGNRAGDKYLDCSDCIKKVDELDRARWHCGWLPRDDWTGHGFPRPLEWPGPADGEPCPGYTTRLPSVLEGSRALAWAKRGSLRDFYDSPITDIARAAVDIVDGQRGEVERHVMREASKGKD